jgi:hypothetical protein
MQGTGIWEAEKVPATENITPFPGTMNLLLSMQLMG